MKMKKPFAIGIIFLFIGVAVAPSINSTVAKASNDNDLVEVTSQACGIQGFGNTTVKLTKEQYNNLEQYLVDFRARLNQTSTREEAVPIFKDAVVQLNKYGLLPKGMNVEQAQKFVTMLYQGNSNFCKLGNCIGFSKSNLTFSNIFCLLLLHCNSTTYNVEFGLLSLPFMFFFALFFIYSFHFYNLKLAFLFLIPTILTAIIGVPALLYNRISPLKLWVIAVISSYNQAWSIGLMGYKKINNLTLLIGFKGFRIILPDKSGYDIGQAMAISTYPI